MIVWLASYPRSGNTLLRTILHHLFGISTYSIHGDNRDIDRNDRFRSLVGHVAFENEPNIDELRSATSTYFLKTHEHADIHVTHKDKTIYVIRDGRMSTASYLQYIRAYGPEKNIGLKDIVMGDVKFGGWVEHVDSWQDILNHGNSLFLRYEDLNESSGYEVDKIADFVGIKKLAEEMPKFNDLRKIDPDFFSKGQTRDWKDDFDDEIHFLFWLKSHHIMKRYGYLEGMPHYFNGVTNQSPIVAMADYSHYLESVLQRTRSLNDAVEILNRRIEALEVQTTVWRRLERFSPITFLKSLFK